MTFINNIVFVIGPSGIGKSSLIKSISTNNIVNVYELDKVVSDAARKHNLIDSGGAYNVLKKLGNHAFFILGMNYLFEVIGRNPNEHYIIDVGAAFQNVNLLKHYSDIYNVICINSKPKISHERYILNRPKDPRDLFTHCAIEYSPTRIDIYNSSTYTIDTSTATLPETIKEFNLILKSVWHE